MILLESMDVNLFYIAIYQKKCQITKLLEHKYVYKIVFRCKTVREGAIVEKQSSIYGLIEWFSQFE